VILSRLSSVMDISVLCAPRSHLTGVGYRLGIYTGLLSVSFGDDDLGSPPPHGPPAGTCPARRQKGPAEAPSFGPAWSCRGPKISLPMPAARPRLGNAAARRSGRPLARLFGAKRRCFFAEGEKVLLR
jgi:hypothetical protein